jgi:hypothetical protein
MKNFTTMRSGFAVGAGLAGDLTFVPWRNPIPLPDSHYIAGKAGSHSKTIDDRI